MNSKRGPEFDRQIVDLRERGKSASEIGAELHVSKNVIIGRMHRIKLGVGQNLVRAYPPEVLQQIITLRRAGKTWPQIGAELGVWHASARRAYKRAVGDTGPLVRRRAPESSRPRPVRQKRQQQPSAPRDLPGGRAHSWVLSGRVRVCSSCGARQYIAGAVNLVWLGDDQPCRRRAVAA